MNILDLVFVASALGDEGQGLVADVNEDGIVNILDLVSVAGALGDVAAAPCLTSTSSSDVDGYGRGTSGWLKRR